MDGLLFVKNRKNNEPSKAVENILSGEFEAQKGE